MTVDLSSVFRSTVPEPALHFMIEQGEVYACVKGYFAPDVTFIDLRCKECCDAGVVYLEIYPDVIGDAYGRTGPEHAISMTEAIKEAFQKRPWEKR